MSVDRMEQHLGTMLEAVMVHGHAIQLVGGDFGARYAYTVGLTPRRLPELVLMADHAAAAAAMLDAAVQAVAQVRGLAPGLVLEPALTGLKTPLRLRGPVVVGPSEVVSVGVVASLYGGDYPVQVWQVLWPDPNGTFPDEPFYMKDAWRQRVLDLAGGGS